MPYDFEPNPKHKRRNQYVGSWTEAECRLIPLAFTSESLRQVLSWGVQSAESPYTHQEIAHWCDRLHMRFLDTDDTPDLEIAIRIAADVDCQWDLFLANTYTLEQLRQIDFATIRLPTQWFVDWLNQLKTSA